MKSFPADILKHHIAIVGKTGSGKTSTEKTLVEQVVDEGFRVCVLDSIKSDWWGITSSASGKAPGLPFKIIGGPHGHVPLHSSAGKTIGQLVGSGKLPLSIIDMADFEAGGLQRFFIAFSEALMKSAKGVVYVVIEEAHEFAPKEKAGVGNENLATHWAKKLATAGRSKGIRLIVATQRTQALHNAVLGSCETLIAHRLTTPADQKPIMEWLKANTDKETETKVAASLSSLPTGTAWICSGEAKMFEMVKIPKFRTYDNTSTPTKDGTEVTVKTAQVDQDQLKTLIGDAMKEAEANDPAALKKQIRELQAQKAAKVAPVVATPDPARESAARAAGHAEGHRAGYNLGYEEGTLEERAAHAQALEAMLAKVKANSLVKVPKPPVVVKIPPPIRKIEVTAKVDAGPAPRSLAVLTGDPDMPGPQRRILQSLACWKSLGHLSPTKEQVAAVAGYSPTSTSFTNPIGALRSSGLISYPSPGHVALEKDMGNPMSAEDARAAVLSILTGPERRIVKALLDMGGTRLRDNIAENSGYSPTSTSFTNPVGHLCTLGILTKPSPGMLAISDWAAEVLA